MSENLIIYILLRDKQTAETGISLRYGLCCAGMVDAENGMDGKNRIKINWEKAVLPPDDDDYK